MINFRNTGDFLDYKNTTGSSIAADAVVVLNPGATGMVGIVEDTIANNGYGALRIRGTFDNQPKRATAELWSQGQKLFYDNTTGTNGFTTQAFTGSTTNTPAGFCVAGSSTASSTGSVLISPIG